MLFIIEEAREIVLDFSKGTVKCNWKNSIKCDFIDNLIFINIKSRNTIV